MGLQTTYAARCSRLTLHNAWLRKTPATTNARLHAFRDVYTTLITDSLITKAPSTDVEQKIKAIEGIFNTQVVRKWTVQIGQNALRMRNIYTARWSIGMRKLTKHVSGGFGRGTIEEELIKDEDNSEGEEDAMENMDLQNSSKEVVELGWSSG
ncbi:uncharacterized protein KY384_007495 [Bacidia gigantensis]|uniref:uncharacterized protein n=1 Tax=Bacidia gigantensis TaxID=2732470 RepID=UPI001D047EE3|nr:uncharacterized protein KY384_007495 [Bacidia gigantensis]KAG8527343.1 hypothetical protein KY384_007495 [Bacidia gigantensis]